MCLLCYSPTGTRPDPLLLEQAGVNNPDGFGWAVLHDGALIVKRTLDLDEAIETYGKAPEGPSLWHARWATHGKINVKNCHPFRTDGGRTVIAHNGILPCQPIKGEALSDTRVFVRDLWPTYSRGVLDHPNAWRALGAFATGSKLVVLTTDPRFKRNAYIVNEHYGDWLEGTWWSNDTYLPPRPSAYALHLELDGDGDIFSRYERLRTAYEWTQLTCQVCDEETMVDLADLKDHYCEYCASCIYCERSDLACQCDETEVYLD
jgi:hypothetical protein